MAEIPERDVAILRCLPDSLAGRMSAYRYGRLQGRADAREAIDNIPSALGLPDEPWTVKPRMTLVCSECLQPAASLIGDRCPVCFAREIAEVEEVG